MTRQVAFGAVIAFILTVVGLSMCKPAELAAAPVPAPTPEGMDVARRIVNARPARLLPSSALRPSAAPSTLAVDAGTP